MEEIGENHVLPFGFLSVLHRCQWELQLVDRDSHDLRQARTPSSTARWLAQLYPASIAVTPGRFKPLDRREVRR